MRIVFMGTPALAAEALASLYEAGYALPLVVTQPDKTAGRGHKAPLSPVKAFAESKGIPVYQPGSLKTGEAAIRIGAAEPDAIVVAAYGKILPLPLLESTPLGCLNVHASLLPAYRGAAPIQWALLHGDKETGVTIMKMDEGVDTGAIIRQERLRIPQGMNFGELYGALSALGARLLTEVLPLWAEGGLPPQKQPVEGATYAPLLTREHEKVDWARPAEAIRNQIRAFCPSPGASAYIGDKEIKILDARVLTEEEAAALAGKTGKAFLFGAPGQIAGFARGQGPVAAAGEGYLLLTRVQPAGKKPMDGWSWLNGSRLAPGQAFS